MIPTSDQYQRYIKACKDNLELYAELIDKCKKHAEECISKGEELVGIPSDFLGGLLRDRVRYCEYRMQVHQKDLDEAISKGWEDGRTTDS